MSTVKKKRKLFLNFPVKSRGCCLSVTTYINKKQHDLWFRNFDRIPFRGGKVYKKTNNIPEDTSLILTFQL